MTSINYNNIFPKYVSLCLPKMLFPIENSILQILLSVNIT